MKKEKKTSKKFTTFLFSKYKKKQEQKKQEINHNYIRPFQVSVNGIPIYILFGNFNRPHFQNPSILTFPPHNLACIYKNGENNKPGTIVKESFTRVHPPCGLWSL